MWKLTLPRLVAAGVVAAATTSFLCDSAFAGAVLPDSAFTNFTSVSLGPTDDGSWPCGPTGASAAVPCPVGSYNGPAPFQFGFDVNFSGIEFSGAYVNANGNITFENYLSTFSPFVLGEGVAIIAPFFADVDTRGSGEITIGTGLLGGFNAFAVDWTGVGYFDQATDKLDTFQLVLVDRPDTGTSPLGDNFDIYFNYDQIQWETGDGSGGTDGLGGLSAVVGISNGCSGAPGCFTDQLPGSAVPGTFLDSGSAPLIATTNDGDPGQLLFEGRDGAIEMPTTSVPEPATLGLLGLGIAGVGFTRRRRKH